MFQLTMHGWLLWSWSQQKLMFIRPLCNEQMSVSGFSVPQYCCIKSDMKSIDWKNHKYGSKKCTIDHGYIHCEFVVRSIFKPYMLLIILQISLLEKLYFYIFCPSYLIFGAHVNLSWEVYFILLSKMSQHTPSSLEALSIKLWQPTSESLDMQIVSVFISLFYLTCTTQNVWVPMQNISCFGVFFSPYFCVPVFFLCVFFFSTWAHRRRQPFILL